MANKWTLRIGAPSFKGGDLDGYSPAQSFDATTGMVGDGNNASPLSQYLQRTTDFTGNLILIPPTNLRASIGGSAEPVHLSFPHWTGLAIQNVLVAGCAAAGSTTPANSAAVAG